MSMILKGITSRLIAVLLGCIMAFLAGELILRKAGIEYPLFPSKVQFGWPTPDTILEKYNPDPDFLWTRKDMNQIVQQAERGAEKIVFLGDSCTEFGSYVSQFQYLLMKKHSEKISVINVGTGGWSSYQGKMLFKKIIQPMKPKIAFFYFGWNDHWLSFGIEDKDIGIYYKRFSVIPEISHLRMVQIFNFLYINYLRKSGQFPNRVQPDDYYVNLSEFINLAKSNGTIPVILTAPSNHIIGKEPVFLSERHLKRLSDLIPLHEKYVELTRKAALENGAILIDLQKTFKEYSQNQRNEYFMPDGIHLTEKGDHIVAEEIMRVVSKENLLE